MRHHDNHAWFSYLVSPFARSQQLVMIAVVDGSGDSASISLYVGENGTIREIRRNGSIFDSLFTASSARRRVAGQLSAVKAAIWARQPMAT
jgi:predicted NodU family carbamoyl transferase